MKKLTLLLLLAANAIFSSCEMLERDATYTFACVDDRYITVDSEGESLHVTCKSVFSIYEYMENGLMIQYNTINEPETGKEYKFIANPETKYLTVKWQWEILFHGARFTGTHYTANVFVVRTGENTKIEITSDTLFARDEPK